MADEFQARSSMDLVDVTKVFAPQRVGVGVLDRYRLSGPAVLGVHMEGQYEEDGPVTSMLIGLDAERVIGLIIQLRAMLLDAGVPNETIYRMMREAHRRLRATMDLDRAPSD